ncbi:hypothetical protein RV11_GL001769 [Enterococcus phoeniculicola]|nr:hypothetical protein RV11_GL001769 [Enterococcus phoeniculicola]
MEGKTMTNFENPDIEKLFLNYEDPYRTSLLAIRELIFKTARQVTGVGKLTESLKWGQPTYSTLETKSGTPIRIDRFEEKYVAIFFNCQTVLIEQFRELFPERLMFSKNRAIVLDPLQELPVRELEFCLSAALIYHKNKGFFKNK